MKGLFCTVFMMFVLSSIVFAASSEFGTNFIVNAPEGEVVDYVPSESFWESYLGYFVLVFVLALFVYFIKTRKIFGKVKNTSKKVKRKK